MERRRIPMFFVTQLSEDVFGAMRRFIEEHGQRQPHGWHSYSLEGAVKKDDIPLLEIRSLGEIQAALPARAGMRCGGLSFEEAVFNGGIGYAWSASAPVIVVTGEVLRSLPAHPRIEVVDAGSIEAGYAETWVDALLPVDLDDLTAQGNPRLFERVFAEG